MKDEQKAKPQLHQSHLNTLWRCGVQFEFRYVKGIIAPPGVANVVGTAVHKSVATNLSRKAAGKSLMKVSDVQDAARDALLETWKRGVRLLPEQQQEGVRRVKNIALQRTTLMAAAHATEIAPAISPDRDGVNWKWVLQVKDAPYDLAGEMDVREAYRSGKRMIRTVRDTKTWGKSRGQSEADRSEQLSIYSMAHKVHFGSLPNRVYLDALVDSKDGAQAMTFGSVRDMKDVKVALSRFYRACEVLEKGVFTPANQSDWWCSTRWCGFASRCPFFRGRVTVPATTGGGRNGTKKA